MVGRNSFRIDLELIQLISNPRDFLFSTELVDRSFDQLGERLAVCRIGDLKLDTSCPFGMRRVALGQGGLDLSQYLPAYFSNRPGSSSAGRPYDQL